MEGFQKEQQYEGSDSHVEGAVEFQENDLEEVEVGEEVPIEDDEYEMEEDNDTFEQEEENEFTANVDDMSSASFRLHSDCVYTAAIHPSKPGVVISGGGDDRAFLWTYQIRNIDQHNVDAPTGKNIVSCIELSGHTDTVASVGFNFDGTMALTGAYDGFVKIWSVETGELLQSLEGPEDIEWAQWHSKGNAVVAGSKDGTIWMWLAENGQCVQVFAGHDGEVTCGMFTRDGKTIVSGGEDGSVRLWAPKTGQCKHIFSNEGGTDNGHDGVVTAVAGNAEGDMAVSGGVDGQVRLYLVSKKKLLQKFTHSSPAKTTEEDASNKLPPPPSSDNDNSHFDPSDDIMEEDEMSVLGVECVGISAKDWKYVASGGMDKTMKIWDMSTGSCRCVCRHEDSVVALKWHDSLPVVATACLDRIVRVWDARSGVCVKELTGHKDIVTYLDFQRQPVMSQDGESSTEMNDVIVSVSDDGNALVFLIDLKSLLM